MSYEKNTIIIKDKKLIYYEIRTMNADEIAEVEAWETNELAKIQAANIASELGVNE